MTRQKIPHLRNVCELLVGDETVGDETVGSEKVGSGMARRIDRQETNGLSVVSSFFFPLLRPRRAKIS